LREIEYKDSEHTFKEKECRGKINKGGLIRLLEKHPDWHLRESAEKLAVCVQAVDKMSKKQGVTCKKFTNGSNNILKTPALQREVVH
jgi:hypothetical protein